MENAKCYAPQILVGTEGLPREQWLEYRRKGIGGSDAAAVLGISPFRTGRDLYYDKLTPELLWLFIERIDIGERPGRYNRSGMQEVRIIYRDIGVVDSTMSAEDAESAEVHFIPSLEMVVQQMAAQTQVS